MLGPGLLAAEPLQNFFWIVMPLLTLASLGLGIYGYRKALHEHRMRTFKELYLQMYMDRQISEALYRIERDSICYKPGDYLSDNLQSRKNVRVIDRLLTFLDTVCYLHSRRVLRIEDMTCFINELLLSYENHAVKDFLKDVSNEYKKRFVDKEPYAAFSSFCLSVLRETFYRSDGCDSECSSDRPEVRGILIARIIQDRDPWRESRRSSNLE